MKTTRINTPSILGDVLAELHNDPNEDYRTEVIGRQTVETINHIAVHRDALNKIIPPDSEADRLRNIMTKLGLHLSDDINQSSATCNNHTVLIEATIANDKELAIILLNHGADPTLADGNDDNTFMHAARGGHSRLLLELVKLIEPETISDKSNNATAQDEKKENLDPTLDKLSDKRLTDLSSPRIENKLQTQPVNDETEKASTAPRQTKEPTMARVRLTPNILTKQNAHGETVFHVIEKYNTALKTKHATSDTELAKLKSRERANSMQQRAAQNQHETYTHFKTLVDELHAKQKVVGQVVDPSDSATTQNTADQRNERSTADLQAASTAHPEYQANITRILQLYGDFFKRKIAHFGQIFRWQALANQDLLRDTKKRVMVREERDQITSTRYAAGNDATGTLASENQPRTGHNVSLSEILMGADLPEYPATEPTLPLHYGDQAKVQAALSLLKDYYAPERAPVPHFFQWGYCRRLLTFHLGRHHCDLAKALYLELTENPPRQAAPAAGNAVKSTLFAVGKPLLLAAKQGASLARPTSQLGFTITSVADIYRIRKRLLAERHALCELPHDAQNKNSIVNSSLTRRLTAMIDLLEQTKAYQARSYASHRATYLDLLDRDNIRMGLLNPF